MEQTLRAGILGTGFMGRVHAQAVQAAGHQIAAIAGSTNTSGSRLAATIPGADAATGIEDLLSRDLDVLHVCTPNSLHREHAEAAIRAGVHVICEKPLAISVHDASALAVQAHQAGLVAAVPFIYRYYPLLRAIRKRIQEDADNPLWLIHGSYLQDWLSSQEASNWRVHPDAGGDSRAFGDIGVHWCDLMEFVTGQRIVKVSAKFNNAFVRQGGEEQNLTEDGAVVAFETDAGAQGSVVVSQASAGRKNRLWLSLDGPLSSYSFDQEAPETAWIGHPWSNEIIHRDPALPGAQPHALPAGHPQGYQQCFNDFVTGVYAAVQGNVQDDLPTFEDGLRAAVITQSVVASARSGQWVDVPQPALTNPTRSIL